jgi:hypothetical protein
MLFSFYITQQAISYLDRALKLQTSSGALAEQTDQVDFIRFKARIIKHSGDLLAAADMMDSARKLELNDRYINNKTVKYLIRAGKMDLAVNVASLFFRDDSKSSSKQADPAVFYENQCAWFENEIGEAAASRHQNHVDVIEALKAFSWVRKHYDQYEDDQMEFHDFVLRKLTFTSYVSVTRFSDTVRKMPAFRRAARGAVGVLLRVVDYGEGIPALTEYLKSGNSSSSNNNLKKSHGSATTATTTPPSSTEKDETEDDTTGVDDDGDNNEQPTNQHKEIDTQAALSALGQQNNKSRTRSEITADPDPKGWKLFQDLSKDPLREARVWVSFLVKEAPQFIDTKLLTFDIAVRYHDFKLCIKVLESLVNMVTPSKITRAQCGGVFERLVPFLRFHALGSCVFVPWMGKSIITTTTASSSSNNNKSNPTTTRTPEFVLDKQLGIELEKLSNLVFGTIPPIELAEKLLLDSSDEHVIVACGTALLRITGGTHEQAIEKMIMNVNKDLKLMKKVRDIFCEFPKGTFDKVKIFDKHREQVLKYWPKASFVIREPGPW